MLVVEGCKQIFDVAKRLFGELDLKCMFWHTRLKNIQDFKLSSFDLMVPWLIQEMQVESIVKLKEEIVYKSLCQKLEAKFYILVAKN